MTEAVIKDIIPPAAQEQDDDPDGWFEEVDALLDKINDMRIARNKNLKAIRKLVKVRKANADGLVIKQTYQEQYRTEHELGLAVNAVIVAGRKLEGYDDDEDND